MCAGAISHARLRRLYFAAADPKGGAVEHGPRFFAQPTCLHAPEVLWRHPRGRERGTAAGVLSRPPLARSVREIYHRVIGGSVRQFAELDDETVAEFEEVDGVEGIGDVAAAFADRGGAMHRRLVAVDQDPCTTEPRLTKLM